MNRQMFFSRAPNKEKVTCVPFGDGNEVKGWIQHTLVLKHAGRSNQDAAELSLSHTHKKSLHTEVDG